MKSLNRRVLYRCVCLILLAVAASPSAGWARPVRHACDVNVVVPGLLKNWATQLRQSWETNDPTLIVKTYADSAYLLPTCDNGPAIGHDAITDYFRDKFLPEHPVATFTFDSTSIRIGGDCANPFASGLYVFVLGKEPERKLVRARFTYIFRQIGANSWRIAQHHSSLEPKGTPISPKPECPEH